MNTPARKYPGNEPPRTPREDERGASGSRTHWIAQLLGRGEDPLTWSIPLFRVNGVQLRMHMIFVVWGAAELLISARPDVLGPLHKAALVASLIAILIVREASRVLLSSKSGWLPGRMVIWQCGALSSPLGLMPRLKAPVSGLIANLFIVVVAISGLLIAGVPVETLWFNPIEPSPAAGSLRTELHIILWWTYYSSVVLLALNLLPMPPMDGGRIVQCLLTKTMGRRGALKGAAQIGLSVAVTLLVVGVVAEQLRLVALAAVGGVVCWIELRRLAFIEDAAVERAMDITDWIEGIVVISDEQVEAVEVEPAPEVPPRPTLDMLLAKVREGGMQSLTETDRELLRLETERLREQKSRRSDKRSK